MIQRNRPHFRPSSTPASGPSPSRRGMLTAAAWGVPVVTLASAAPAFAVSSPVAKPGAVTVYSLASSAEASGEVPQVERCSSLSAGRVIFTAAVDNVNAPVGSRITVSLPAGLAFIGGARSTDVVLTQPGIALVPAFTATGAAGTYTITAAWNGALATQSVSVVPAPGSVVELRRSTAGAGSTATFSTLAVGVTDAVAGSVQGDQSAASAGANGAVLTSGGRVRVWGANVGATAASPLTLPITEKMAFLSSWTSIGTSSGASDRTADATGGVTAGTSASSVKQWYRTGTGTGAPTVSSVTGIAGTVRAVSAEDGASYVLTSSGVHRWVNGTGSTAVRASMITGTGSANAHLSTWSHRGPSDNTLRSGGASAAGKKVVTWVNRTDLSKSPTSTVLSLPSSAGTATKLVSTDSGLMVLDSKGTLWSYGSGFEESGWKIRSSDVADFSMWGFTADSNYVGGLWITTSGQVQQFFGRRSWVKPVPVLATDGELTGITQTYSADGTYLALKSDGTVYAWGGNLDNAGRGAAKAVNTGAGTTVDLNVWGKHIGTTYYGGGYVIKGAPIC